MKKNWINIAAAFLMMAGSTEALAATEAPVPTPAEGIADVTPFMRKDGGKVYLNYLNLEGNTVVVKVIDDEGRVLYSEKFTESPTVEKAFNFERAHKGTYSVEVAVSEGDRTYSETLKVVR